MFSVSHPNLKIMKKIQGCGIAAKLLDFESIFNEFQIKKLARTLKVYFTYLLYICIYTIFDCAARIPRYVPWTLDF